MDDYGKSPNDHDSEDQVPNRPEGHSIAGIHINVWVFIGYFSCLAGGLMGMFIGSALVSAKKILPDGRIINSFSKRIRRHGKIILYLGSAILILSILFFINWFILEKILFGKQ
ncbi:MAG TPA: hypothetical protein VK588_11060 [Chitinophagaceae bacterium]|nr:hypothetical protein [Chitinophagaceae bacterium]